MRPVVAANWKMNHGPAAAREFGEALAVRGAPDGVEVVVFPPALSLPEFARHKPTWIAAGVQSVGVEVAGAHTGENSAAMAREAGATWALVGHSERRTALFHGGYSFQRRMEVALDAGLTVVYCCGEREHQRESGETEEVLRKQLEPVRKLSGEEPSSPGSRVLVAYEPVWAIGSGHPATPSDAAMGANICRRVLGDDVRVLYGGSVNADNLRSFLGEGEVDGVLVGGASLTLDGLMALIRAAA
ncbi:triose-phosphate isomerase [bacterium]|nr:triose-phosphate isomerase [bacterium]